MDSFTAANAAEEARQEAEREQSGKDLQTRLNLIRARKQKEQVDIFLVLLFYSLVLYPVSQ